MRKIGIRTSDFDTILFIRSAELEHSGKYELSVQIENMEDKAVVDICVVGEDPGSNWQTNLREPAFKPMHKAVTRTTAPSMPLHPRAMVRDAGSCSSLTLELCCGLVPQYTSFQHVDSAA
ncbi:UNVERIFIED_CONTAM: hypothetical protein FKN15_073968 [Acipenser sinensis]